MLKWFLCVYDYHISVAIKSLHWLRLKGNGSKCAYAIGPRHISQEIDVKAQQSQRDLRGVEAQLIALLVVGWRRGRDVAKLRVLFQNPQYVSKNKS